MEDIKSKTGNTQSIEMGYITITKKNVRKLGKKNTVTNQSAATAI